MPRRPRIRPLLLAAALPALLSGCVEYWMANADAFPGGADGGSVTPVIEETTFRGLFVDRWLQADGSLIRFTAANRLDGEIDGRQVGGGWAWREGELCLSEGPGAGWDCRPVVAVPAGMRLGEGEEARDYVFAG